MGATSFCIDSDATAFLEETGYHLIVPLEHLLYKKRSLRGGWTFNVVSNHLVKNYDSNWARFSYNNFLDETEYRLYSASGTTSSIRRGVLHGVVGSVLPNHPDVKSHLMR